MARKKRDGASVIIDGSTYAFDGLTENAKLQLLSLNAVDRRIREVEEDLAILKTARIAYSKAILLALSEND